MATLFILNDGPYGSERSFNALRLAGTLAKRGTGPVQIFLMGDSAVCAKHGQKVPEGHYNMEHMLSILTRRGHAVAVCGTCMDARGITDEELAEGTRRGTMAELADWTEAAERVLVF